MSEPALLYEKQAGVAVLTMNRPEVRNAMNAEMLCRLADAWQDVNDDPEVRCAILTGTGEQAFCAGADLGEFIPMMQGLKPPRNEFDERAKADPGIVFKGLLRSIEVYKPIIAAVNGASYAGGTEILQTTDIRVAAEDVRFAISEVKRSLFPMGGSTVRLVRQIPWCMAMEILLTGEPISAAEAWRIGLINKVVPRRQLMAEAQRYAAILAENGPLAVQAVKRSVLAGSGLSLEEALQEEAEIGIPVSGSEDAREGPRAFKEKRKPVYKGR